MEGDEWIRAVSRPFGRLSRLFGLRDPARLPSTLGPRLRTRFEMGRCSNLRFSRSLEILRATGLSPLSTFPLSLDCLLLHFINR